jgi:hypothetical protein
MNCRSNILSNIDLPFGEADCETEVELLKDEYRHLFFSLAPFNADAVEPHTYLIIGRRGSGKTALAQYFSFHFPKSVFIFVHSGHDSSVSDAYQDALSAVVRQASESREVAIPRLMKIWEHVFWRVLVRHAVSGDDALQSMDASQRLNWTHGLQTVVESFRELLSPSGLVATHLDRPPSNDEAAQTVLQIASKRPIILAIDTLERYDIADAGLMNAMAALIQSAYWFNLKYRDRGVHIKIFMSGEVFPYLYEEVIQNSLKTVKHPVHLLWRPKDLMRLVSWRFNRYLDAHNLLLPESRVQIDWTNNRQVYATMWSPYFGATVANARQKEEDTFSYILRHTQMRPRQLILLCNSIAMRAMRGGRFPRFSQEDIRQGIAAMELHLSIEIIGSFGSQHSNVSTIVDALKGMPMLFTGSELDIRAKESASAWPPGTYSQTAFRPLLAELGIVGIVRRHNEQAGYIDADFQYSLERRLTISHRDPCVIHPMFFKRFEIDVNSESRVIPFSTERGGHTDVTLLDDVA